MPTPSRRGVAVTPVVCVLALAACTPSAAEDDPSRASLPATIAVLMDQPVYADARWGLSVLDVDDGAVLVEHNSGELFRTGSTAKILSVTAALEALGPDHVFETPVFAVGQVTAGRLTGDLVLRGIGDLTLGGRTLPDGTIDVPIFDHYDANALPGVATLTPQDPLAGLDALAAQVAASGVTAIDGDVLVDDRLWEPVVLGDVPVSSIVVNDNLLDFLITPGAAVGDAASFTWRPRTAAYRPVLEVVTGAADSGISLTVDAGRAGALVIRGSVPLGADPVVWTHQVDDPATWARTLFLEALTRAGIAVAADPLAENDGSALPEQHVLDGMQPIAVFTSPPFSETARLINKVSHNLGANQLPLLLAAQDGQRTLDAGLDRERATLEAGGLSPDEVIITDGQGLRSNLISPSGMTGYLRYLTGTDTFDAFSESTPILGVDGTLASVLPAGDPAIGAAHAKTGTLVGPNAVGGLVLETKALAGYVDTQSGRRLAFAVFVNDVPIDDVADLIPVGEDIAAIVSQLYRIY